MQNSYILLNVKVFTYEGYGKGTFAPGVEGIGTTSYISAHNQILAHARAYRLYQTKYAQTQGGKVGITLNIHWAEPENPNNVDHLGMYFSLFRDHITAAFQMHLKE